MCDFSKAIQVISLKYVARKRRWWNFRASCYYQVEKKSLQSCMNKYVIFTLFECLISFGQNSIFYLQYNTGLIQIKGTLSVKSNADPPRTLRAVIPCMLSSPFSNIILSVLLDCPPFINCTDINLSLLPVRLGLFKLELCDDFTIDD